MLTRIRVLDYVDESFVDFLAGPDAAGGGLRIVNVDGLGPAPAQVRFTNHVMTRGGTFNSTVVNTRNIVITAELHPDYVNGLTVQDIRRELYAICVPGEEVRIRLYNNGSYESRVDGHIEAVEPVMFSKEPQVQVSIVCTNPYFRSPSEQVVTDLTPEIRTINYDSQIPGGLTLDIRPNRTIQWIEIQDFNYPIDSRPTLRINHTFEAGHRLRVVTTPGRKEASLRTDSTGAFLQRLIGNVRSTNGWPMLRPGTNRLRVRGSQDNSLRWDITMIKQYAGF